VHPERHRELLDLLRAAEEDRFFSADPVWERAALVVDGAPGLAHDPETEYVRLR